MLHLNSLYCSFNMNMNINYTHGLETLVFCEVVRGILPGYTLEKWSSFQACIFHGLFVGLLWFLIKYHVWKKYSFSTLGFCMNPQMVFELPKRGNYSWTRLVFIMVIGISKKGNHYFQDNWSHFGKLNTRQVF